METLNLPGGNAAATSLIPVEQATYSPDAPGAFEPPAVSPGWPVLFNTGEDSAWRAGQVVNVPRRHSLVVSFVDFNGHTQLRDMVVHKDDPRVNHENFKQSCRDGDSGIWQHTPLYEQMQQERADLTTAHKELVDTVSVLTKELSAMKQEIKKFAIKRGPNKKQPNSFPLAETP